MPNNYDPVAKYYDLLSRLVFGRSEIRAQVEMLKYTPVGSKVLIVGGGTGWILERLAAIHPRGLQVTYVEPSAAMMAIAMKRDWQQNEVVFVQKPVERFATEEQYDCIVTGFVFDNFCKARARWVIKRLYSLVRPGGYWLFADFYLPKREGKWWHGLMLRSMYWSARWMLRVEANELTDTEPMFSAVGLRQVKVDFYYHRFIKSIVYQKGESF